MRSNRIAAVILAGALGGCTSASQFYSRLTGADQPKQVSPEEFVQHSGAEPGADNPHTGQVYRVPATVAPTPNPTPQEQRAPIDQAIASVVEQGSPATRPASAVAATTLPSGPAQTLASGQYMTLGGVVAEVNGTPIYINKVLQLVWPTLHNDARSMDADHFILAARDEITREISVLESDELLFAAADQALDTGDKKLVEDLTTAYHQTLVTQAGGSLEIARRKAAANGDDFDQLIRDQYRRYMIELYQQRKFAPLAEPSAQEMRNYYLQHRQEAFITDQSEAGFDLLKIDPAQMTGDSPQKDREMAFARAKEAHDRAASGATFATIFKEYNNDPGLNDFTNGTGNMGVFQRGSFNIKQIEDAVWTLQPGQVTDVIEVDGVLYIARMESRKVGVVRPFEDEDVQTRIAGDLRRDRFSRFYEDEKRRLLGEAITTTYDDMFSTAVDMSMQSYQVWSQQK